MQWGGLVLSAVPWGSDFTSNHGLNTIMEHIFKSPLDDNHVCIHVTNLPVAATQPCFPNKVCVLFAQQQLC